MLRTQRPRVSRDEAAQFRSAILGAMQEQEAKASAPVVVQAAPAVPAPAAAAPDLTAQLQQLAALRDAGVLTEEEFAAKKADILARI